MAAPAVSLPARGNHVDLQGEWRVVVITPILAGGGFVLGGAESGGAEESGIGGTKITLTMKAGDEFLGYEESRYAVEPRGGKGEIRMRLEEVTEMREGQKVAKEKPRLGLFDLPREMRHVRLIYLRRSEQASHNMAVVAAADRAGLEEVTKEVEADPVKGCGMEKGRMCRWVPAGVAVRPERRDGEMWKPVR